jgi:hypothetical protein
VKNDSLNLFVKVCHFTGYQIQQFNTKGHVEDLHTAPQLLFDKKMLDNEIDYHFTTCLFGPFDVFCWAIGATFQSPNALRYDPFG